MWLNLVFKNIMQKRAKFSLERLLKQLNLEKKEFVTLLLITFASIFLRFVNYGNRWGLAYDQARDVIVSHQILVEMEIPVSGPFSASGPFVFGPFWYWFHSLLTLINPSSVMWLWIIQTSISSFMPVVMFFIGRKILNNKFGLLLAFLTAISTAQIAQATNLTYSTFVGFISVFVLLTLTLFLSTKKTIYVFLMSFLMGLAINIHFQAVGYFLFLPIILILNIKSFKNIAFIILGFSIPFIPLIIFDFISNHYQSSNILKYLLDGGSTLALPKRWLTYISVYWPNVYSHIIGGYWPIGILMATVSSIVLVFSIWKRKIEKTIIIVLIFFLLNFVVLRYFKGNIYDSFLVFLHPYILLITAWVVYKVVIWKKTIGFILLSIIIISTFAKNYEEIVNATNYTSKNSIAIMNNLENEFPGERFAAYDYQYKNSSRSVPVVMYLFKNNLISDEGRKIGFVTATISAELEIHNAPLVLGNLNEIIVLDLSKYSKKELEGRSWVFINPSGIYESVIHWYEKESQ